MILWLACAAPQLSLGGTCAGADPCLVADGGTVHVVATVDGQAPDTVSATSDAAVVRVRAAEPRQIVLAGVAPGLAIVTVTATRGGATATATLRLDVREVADLGVVIDGPITADTTYAFAITPRDAAGAPLAWAGFASAGPVPLACARGTCRVTLPAGTYQLWNGEARPLVPITVGP